jgi:hypothetical protein
LPAAGPWPAWVRFWFTAVDPSGLHAVRVLAGLLFLAWLLPFAGQEAALFGPQGWFDTQAYAEAARLPGGPPAPLGWSLVHACGSSPALLHALYWLSLAVLLLFTLGLWPRVTAVLTWVVVVSFATSPAISFDADSLLGILAFYLMVGYLLLGQWGGRLSPAERLLGPAGASLLARLPTRQPASHAANLALRLLQVHFALAVVVGGLHKLQFGDWWAGLALWYSLHPPFETTPEGLRALAPQATPYLILLSLAGYAVLAWQLGFPAFAWRRRWRPLLLAGGLVGWAGSVLVYRQPLFGPVLGIACLSYLTPGEWARLLAWPGRLAGLPGAAHRRLAGRPRPARLGTKV